MAITSRLGLHKPETSGEFFGDYFPDAYAADLQQIDDVVQIKDVAAAGNIPVYGVDGLLADSGIAPADLEAGLISSILTDQGMLLYKAADALAALSPDVAGKSLLTQGAGANPVFGYPSHSTLTNLGIGDPHTQYVLRSLLSARGDLVYRDAAGWQRLPKGVSGTVLMQGANDPYWSMPKLDDLAVPDDNTDLNASTTKHGLMQKYPGPGYLLKGDGTWLHLPGPGYLLKGDGTWLHLPGPGYLLKGDGTWLQLPNTAQALKGDGTWLTRYFDIDFQFGNGQDVVELNQLQEVCIPVNAKLVRVDGWEVNRIIGSTMLAVRVHDIGGDPISASIWSRDSFVSASYFTTVVDPPINISAHKVIQGRVASTSTAKQVVLRLVFEAL